MKTILGLSRVCVATLVIASASSQAAVTLSIDDFHDTLSGPLTVNSTSPTDSSGVTSLTAPSLVGTTRTLTLDYISGSSSAKAETLSAPGRLSLSAGPGAVLPGTPPVSLAATTAVLTAFYDFTPTGQDFTVGGGSAIAVDSFTKDPGVAAKILVKVVTSAGMGSAMIPFELGLNEIPFASFGAVDFTNVTSMEVKIDPQPAFDGSIRLIGVTSTAVPEPSGSLAFIGLLAGLIVRRRRS